MEQASAAASHEAPWNKGRLVGQKHPVLQRFNVPPRNQSGR